MSDADHMAHALRLAARGLGNVWPNPAVGCVLLREGQVVESGSHAELVQRGGFYADLHQRQLLEEEMASTA